MTKEDKYFDELLRGKMAEHEVKPPAYVWERIAEVQQQKRRKRLFLYYKISGIAAVVLLAFIFGWQINSQLQLNDLQPKVAQTEDKDEAVKFQESQVAPITTHENKTDEQLVSNAREIENIQEEVITKTTPIDQLVELTSSNEAKEQVDQKDSYSFLKAIKLPRLTFETIEIGLMPILVRTNTETQLLTAEDLETIKRNEQLQSMKRIKEDGENWQIAALVAPNYSINQTSYQSSYASNMSVPGSKENMSLGGGLSVEYKAGKRFSIQSGVYYSQLEQTSSNYAGGRGEADYLVQADNAGNFFNNAAIHVKSDQVFLNASAGVVELSNLPSDARIGSNLEELASNNSVLLDDADFQQNFEYVEIPFNLRFKVIDTAFDVSLLGGLSTNFLVGNNVYLSNEEGQERIGETTNMRKINYSTSFGVGFSYGISNRISMRLEPQIKYYLGSLNSNSAVSFKPYTIGVYTGLSYHF